MESDDSDIGDMLDDLLANADPTETENIAPNKTLKELNFNFLDSQANTDEPSRADRLKDDGGPSLVHEAGLDSSDDEDKRNPDDQKYSEFGRELKNLLKRDAAPPNRSAASRSKHDSTNGASTSPPSAIAATNVKKTVVSASFSGSTTEGVYRDPIFGLKLVKPLISSHELIERMRGRNPVTVSTVRNHIAMDNTRDDWVIAGVIINRSTTKTSQKGSQYCIWKLSDLSDQMNTVSLFLFSGAYKLFWKTTTGTVVGILNPGVLESKDNVDQATLSVDNAQKLMIFGVSRDMAKCKSTKKNGEPCSNIINLSRGEYCVYHVKQEYTKASRRPDIQSNSSGRGPFAGSQPKNKPAALAGIYAQGGPNFTPILAKKNYKMYERDSARLALLRGGNSANGNASTPSPKIEKTEEPKRKACSVELTTNQTKKDLERLNKLRGWNVGKPMCVVTSDEASSSVLTSKTANDSVTPKASNPALTSKTSNPAKTTPVAPPGLPVPRLGAGVKGGSVDFSQPITKKHVNNVRMNAARLNAARWIKDNCVTLKQSNPNKIRESREKIQEASAKRQRDVEDADDEIATSAKKTRMRDRFKEMMEAKSAHVDLVEKKMDDDQDKYFDKLEMKERMEEKMLTTFKVDCKAVKCIVCRYTSFSASDYCKQQKHPLKVVDATKSFFKCSDCGNRTISLDRMPSLSCKKCNGSNWVRAAMMDEKKTDIAGAKLSIRGGEETFIGSVTQDANLNLLVPDSGTVAS